MSEQPGIFPQRRCTEQEQKLIKDVYETIRHHIDRATNATVWYNIFMDDKYTVEMNELYNEFDKWIRDIVLSCGGEGKTIHSYGFFFTPKHSIHNQEYHLDYYPEVEEIFIPMVPVSTKNSTRFMTSYALSKPDFRKYASCRFGNEDEDLLEKEGVDCIQVAQVICRDFMILHMHKNTVHKGIANSADYDRPMVFATFSSKV